ncbi:MAG: hypothetical protein H6752_08765 [Candidatus Omnitrophica bacterium]|nr:hypothetical protein [Candidatus Omnitrophota bacterium]
MRRMIRGILSLLLAFLGAGISFAENPIQLEPAIEAKCLEILRSALRSEEFWPSMHAAEAMTLAGHGEEIRETLESRLEAKKTINTAVDWRESWSAPGTARRWRS